MNTRFLCVVTCVATLAGSVCRTAADTTDAPWIYVPGLTAEEEAIKTQYKGHATGVITNGDWRLFAILSGTNIEINVYRGGWSTPVRDSYIAGSGRLDLSLPVQSEDGATKYCFNRLAPNCFRTDAPPTELVCPKTITEIGNYIFYQNEGSKNGASLTNIVIDCPNLTAMGEGIVFGRLKLTGLTLKAPLLKTIRADAFNGCQNLSNMTVRLPSATRYASKCFYTTRMRGLDPYEDLNLHNVTNIGDFALNAYNGSTSLKGDGVLRMDKLQTLGQYGIRYAQFGAVLIGYDDLVSIAENGANGVNSGTLVIGSGPNPVTLGYAAIPSACHNLYFRGGVPTVTSAEGSITMEGVLWTAFYVRYDEAGWRALARAATGNEISLFQERFPSVPVDRLAGVIPQGTVGNIRDAFLVYEDYRIHESRLFVEVDARFAAQCPVTPAAGMHAADYAPGEQIQLTAPNELVQVGDIKVKATKYVVSEIDHLGHWAKNVTTNEYSAADPSANVVTMPAEGSLKVEWIFDEVYAVNLAPLNTALYPEQVQCQGADVSDTLWIAKGETCTLVARATVGGTDSPATRFVRWEGDIGEADPTNPVLVLTPTDAVHVKAVFAHDWLLATSPTVSGDTRDTTMTDGNWVLRVRRLEDNTEGNRTLIMGQAGSYANQAGAITSGSGTMDLSTKVFDPDGNEYVITQFAYDAFRPGQWNNPSPNACTEFIAPRTLEKMGQYVFYNANAALTNVVLDCPKLTTIARGQFMLCSKLEKVYFSAPLLENIPNGGFWEGMFESCNAMQEFQLDLPKVKAIPMKFCAKSPLTRTDCTKWNLDSVTNVMDWAFGGDYAGPYGELRLPSLEVLTGSRQFAQRRGITKLVLGSGKLRLLGSQGAAGQSSDTQALCVPQNAFMNMFGLRHVELGLAPDAVIPDGIFPGLGQDMVTNVTFTAAPPSNTNIFAAVAKKTTIPNDGTKTVRVYADWNKPGWRDNGEFAATAEALGILGFQDLTAAEKTAYDAFSRDEKRRWMGLVHEDARFAWLFYYGDLPAGTKLIFR